MGGRSLRVAIVGAGLGGLASALRLSHAGYEVEVFEKNPQPGGRCYQLQEQGFRFDTGPTILLMPEVLEETFRSAGLEVSDHLTLTRCSPNYRIHFRGGSQLTLTPV